jgi:hypothetical protein
MMGDIKAFNSAGVNDDPNTVTNANGTTGRVIDLFMTKQELEDLQNQVAANAETVSGVIQDAPEELNSFKEVSDELDVDSFMSALNSED